MVQKKLKELGIMYENAFYICISWYSKICWFAVKKCWCQQNSRGVSRDSSIFWIFFWQGISVPGFIIVGYVWQILGREAFLPLPPILEQPRKIPSWIGLRDKAFKIANDLKCDGYQRGLALVFYKFFDKKSSGGGVDAEPNYQLENELQKKIIRRLKRRKVYLSFRDNIWGVDLADVQSLSK